MEKLEYVVRINAGAKVSPKIIGIRGTSDMFDRYKMRQLFVQIVGKGKMIRTVLLNVDDVAKDLKTEPAYLGAYFGYELGAQSKYDAKKPERERASVSGEFDSQQLSQLMKKFVREVVQCPGCHLPETTLTLDKKSQDIAVRCSGCGHTGTLKVENSKFLKFIVTHPPTAVNTKTISSKQADKKDKDDKEEKSGDGRAEPKAAPARAKTAKASAGAVPEVDESDWAVSTDAEAVKERMAKLLPSAAVKALVSDDAAAAAGPAMPVEKALEELRAAAAKPAAEFVADGKRLAAAARLDSKGAARLVMQAQFSAQTIAKERLKAAQPALEPFLGDEEAQLAALQCVEEWVEERAELLKKATALVKELYDLELVGEDAVLAWHATPAKQTPGAAAVRKELDVMVNWLKTAEEDEDEDEEEEEEEPAKP